MAHVTAVDMPRPQGQMINHVNKKNRTSLDLSLVALGSDARMILSFFAGCLDQLPLPPSLSPFVRREYLYSYFLKNLSF